MLNVLRWLLDLYRAERRYVRAQMNLSAGDTVTTVVYVRKSVKWLPRDCE